MRRTVAFLAAGMLVASAGVAAARDDGHREPGPVLDFVGDVFMGVVKVATAPLWLLADIGRGDWHERERERIIIDDGGAYATNKEQARAYYGADARFYGPPPGHFPAH